VHVGRIDPRVASLHGRPDDRRPVQDDPAEAKTSMDTLGRHVIAELDGCDAAVISEPELVRKHLVDAARRAGATVISEQTFEFKNGGVSGFVLLAESHISIHTRPEHDYAAIDIYTCGDHTMPDKGAIHLADVLGATQIRMTSMARGVPGQCGGHDHLFTPLGRGKSVPTVFRMSDSA
jgi:S-adenosylmethionine decarboxylase